MSEREDPIERLARRTAEETDRLARERQEEWMNTRPIFPKWFIWLGIILFLIIAIGLISVVNQSNQPFRGAYQ